MAEDTDATDPIVIDLGKTRRKWIKQLKQGRGQLLDEVQQAIGEVRARLGEEAKDKEFVPVVLLYSRKRKRKMSMFPMWK